MLTAEHIATRLEISATAAAIRQASEWLSALGEQHDLPPEPTHRLDICLNESLANVMTHGGPSALRHPVVLQFHCRDDTHQHIATLTVSDAGRSFDPAHPQIKARPATLDEAEPGGLGLLMMHRSADRIIYHRMGDRNVVAFTVRWTQ